VYAGTGEVNPGGGSITYEGTGLYASRNGGRTWRLLGLPDSGAIGAITVDPADPKRIFVAAAGSLYNPGGERGVYRSTDGGATWRRVLAGANGFTGATEVLLDPRDRRRMYAVMWDHRLEPDLRTYGGVGSGVYRSTDGGTTWALLSGGLPGAGPDVGRIGLGQAPSDPDRLYAIVNKSSGPFEGFYGSVDAGDTWTRLPDTPELTASQSSFGWWFGKVWVDPRQPQHVHVAGVPLMTTKDGGQTWLADDASIHVDQHAMIWDPRRPGRVYLGNDGVPTRTATAGGSRRCTSRTPSSTAPPSRRRTSPASPAAPRTTARCAPGTARRSTSTSAATARRTRSTRSTRTTCTPATSTATASGRWTAATR
jgi:hypothetical protein